MRSNVFSYGWGIFIGYWMFDNSRQYDSLQREYRLLKRQTEQKKLNPPTAPTDPHLNQHDNNN